MYKMTPVVDELIAQILRELKSSLDPRLTYHSFAHTIDVMKVAKIICQSEGLDKRQTKLIELAAAYHDSGKLITYHHHEEASCDIVERRMRHHGFESRDRQEVSEMIMATKVPQIPRTKSSMILCDADLDYLGRDDYPEISETLYGELKAFDLLANRSEWLDLQIRFLEKHRFWTAYGQNIRERSKNITLSRLKEVSLSDSA